MSKPPARLDTPFPKEHFELGILPKKKEIFVCSGCGKELQFVKEGEGIFCGKTGDFAKVIKKEVPE